MSSLVMAAFGALVGAGLVAAAAAIRGQRLFPNFVAALERSFESLQRLSLWTFASIMVGAVVIWLTGWPIAGLWSAAGVLSVPLMRGRTRRSINDEIARVEAIATWSEQIRDAIGASAGLQQALIATASRPPAALDLPLRTFARRAAQRDLPSALRRLGADLGHPAGDLVIAGLISACELDAGRLVPLLNRLAASIRGEADMRVRVEVSRARVRMSMRIVGASVLLTMALLLVAGGDLLGAYDGLAGQLWLLCVGGVLVLAVWSSQRLSELPQPDRFVARRLGA